MRQKELAEFNDEEKDMLAAIGALTSAVTVLSKHNSASSMLQVDTTQMQVVATKIQNVLQQHTDALKHVLTHSERKTVAAFIQSPQDYMAGLPHKSSYAPQSGAIFGILGQMKETFETNLATSQKEETTGQAGFQDLKAGKEMEISKGQSMIDKKSAELATTDEKNAQAQEDLAETKKTLAADEEFLASLKEQCSLVDAEWEERSKTRQLEMQATSKAMAVLSSDDARDLTSRSLGFVQKESTVQSKRRAKASEILAAAAKKTQNPRLSALAYRVKLDGFAIVKKGINTIIADIQEQKDDEIKLKDFCTDSLNTNELTTEQKNFDKENLLAKIADFTDVINQLEPVIEKVKMEIGDIQVQLKRAGEDREAENKQFQATVADQRATQKLLTKALTVLEGFYGKAAFVQGQQEQPAGPPPPPGFKAYKKNSASGGIMGMMTQIIEDAKAMEDEALADEGEATKSYEKFVKEANASIEAKTKSMTNMIEEKSKAEVDKVEAEKELAATDFHLEQLADEKAKLHAECDFTLKNFEISQAGKDEEMEVLKQALATFSGGFF